MLKKISICVLFIFYFIASVPAASDARISKISFYNHTNYEVYLHIWNSSNWTPFPVYSTDIAYPHSRGTPYMPSSSFFVEPYDYYGYLFYDDPKNGWSGSIPCNNDQDWIPDGTNFHISITKDSKGAIVCWAKGQ
jgi:hypothetical protein